jgi:hypothetical protein
MNVILNEEQDEAQVVELTPEEGRSLFDREAQRLLGVGGEEFVTRYEAGEYGDDDPRIMRVAMLLPFWQAGHPTKPSTTS